MGFEGPLPLVLIAAAVAPVLPLFSTYRRRHADRMRQMAVTDAATLESRAPPSALPGRLVAHLRVIEGGLKPNRSPR